MLAGVGGPVSWVLTDPEPPGWMTAPWLDLVLAPASCQPVFLAIRT